MSKFDGIESAKTSDRLPYINPGKYVLEVESVKVINSRTKGDMFIAEFKVLESFGPDANAAGTSCSHLTKMALDNALGNIKSFVSALTGDKNVTGAMVENLVSPENPGKGAKVRAEAFLTKTKAGADFTRINYSYFGEDATEAPKPATKKK